jgi:hypothetical protein
LIIPTEDLRRLAMEASHDSVFSGHFGPNRTWTNVIVDMITGLPMTARGYNAIIVFVDRLTKMVHIVPTTETLTSRGFAELLLNNVIRLHGCPEALCLTEVAFSTVNLRKNSSKASTVNHISPQHITLNPMDKLKEPTKSWNKF